MEEEIGFSSYDKDMLLKDEIKSREEACADILALEKTLSSSIELYAEKCDLKASAGYLIMNTCNWDRVYEYDTMRIKMLGFISEEMRLWGERVERYSRRIKGSNLLPYAEEKKTLILLNTFLEKVDFFSPDSFSEQFGEDELREALQEARKALNVMRGKHYTIVNACLVAHSQIEPIFSSILERYEKDNRAMLDNYIDEVYDIREAKGELKRKFENDKAVEIWENEGRDIVRTIREMNKQGCVMRDLLPLLEYKAKWDRLTARERGMEEPKKQLTEKKKKGRGRPKSILFGDKEVKQRECERVKGYLREGSSQVAKWRRDKTNTIQKVAICFVRHWKEHGYIDEDYSPRALAKFFVEDCGVQMAEPGKDIGKTYDNLGQGVKENEADFDEEIYSLVGGKFKK